jgi:exodeoxyribonuclease V beta subunit
MSTNSFDLATPTLETGRVVIQASAGTGKTYALTVLAVRHVAERGIEAGKLLMVTFTNAATAELRDKTREQARETLHRLRINDRSQPWMAQMMADEDSIRRAITNIESFLARFDDTTITTIHGFCQVVLRRAGLQSPAPPGYTVRDEVDDIIDQVITDLFVEPLSRDASLLHGVSRGKAPDKNTLGEAHKLRADDVRKSLSRLKDAVVRAMGNPRAVILPDTALYADKRDTSKMTPRELEITGQAELIAEATRKVISEVRRRCRDAGIVTYDDMVRLVADTLDPLSQEVGSCKVGDKESAADLAANIASQFSIVMVDEFQDTDASQWAIFSRIFDAGSESMTLITVGDPKQAIYRFRGADVQVYLDAVNGVEQQHALGINYRSDVHLLEALKTILSGLRFAAVEGVEFLPVEAPPTRTTRGLLSASDDPPHLHVPGAPLEIRYLTNHSNLGAVLATEESEDDEGQNKVKESNNEPSAARGIFWRDMANHVVELLEDGLLPDNSAKTVNAMRRIIPSDIAVLVNSHRDAETAVRYLHDAKVRAVRYKTDSVFRSDSAKQWLMLLGALANPGKPQFVRARALSWFGGYTDGQIAIADDDLVATWQHECAQDGEVLLRRGLTALYLSYRNKPEFIRRVLSEPDGERHITDLDHIAELLAALPRFARSAGAAECFEEMNQLVEDSRERVEEHERRIEGDEVAVKVMTIHASKGLQFPIVFLPTLSKPPSTHGTNPRMFSFRFPGETSTRRVIDVASAFENAKKWVFDPTGTDASDLYPLYKNAYSRRTPGTKEWKRYGRELLAAEDAYFDALRLLYVALTRAEHKIVIYWSAVGETGKDSKGKNTKVPLARVLASHFNLDEMPTDDMSVHRLMKSIADASNGTIESIPLPDRKSPKKKLAEVGGSDEKIVSTASFTRDEPVTTFGHARWSYSGLAETLKGRFDAEGSDLAGATDETNDQSLNLDMVQEIGFDRDATIASMPLYGIAGSAEFGTALHEIIDAVDPGHADIDSILAEAVELRYDLWADPSERALITAGLSTAFRAPLGSPFEGNTLRSLGKNNRLSELEFNFRLPQDSPFTLRRIGELMLEHGDLDPKLTVYAQSIADKSTSARVAGFMRGFIDAVFRIEAESGPVYVVADYKSNRLHDPKNEDAHPLAAYHPDALVEPMGRNDYILQALVYSVALHRYLRWRQPGYDPNVHLGGSAYLFLRGMTGQLTTEEVPRPFGVHHWQPTPALIESVDRLFAKGS